MNSKLFILIAFSQICLSYCFKFEFVKSDPDEFRNTSELIKNKGYPVEEHDVLTQDDYILTIFRIPFGRTKPSKNENRPVVFLQHGLLDSSSTFVVNFQEQSLGFILADAGFDVWIGNMRGNTYGLRHKKFSPSQEEFWDFSWDEMAAFDLPAMINYALKISNQANLSYIGHSQGTLIGFSQFNSNNQLSSKINLFVAMGPVATVQYMTSPIRYLALMGSITNQKMWFNIFGKKSFLPSNYYVEWFADKFCKKVISDPKFCEFIVFQFCGPSKHLNQSRVAVYTTHTPAGSSVKNLAHFGQMVISGKFQMYDYGSSNENMKRYNKSTPPLYSLTNVNVPVALHWAENDWLADPKDIQYLRNNLPYLVDDFNVDDYDHLDFLWATNAKQALYDRIVQLLNKFI